MLLNKDWESTYQELITFYPTFYRDVLEMQAILKAHGELTDEFIENLETGFANIFLDTADETMIARLEKFLGLEANAELEIENRRSIVKSYFAGFGKVSASVLCEIISNYTHDEVTATFEPADDEKNNLLEFNLVRGDIKSFPTVAILQLLSMRLPAHIWRRLNVIKTYEHSLYFAVMSIFLDECELSTEEEIELGDYYADENGAILTDELENIIVD